MALHKNAILAFKYASAFSNIFAHRINNENLVLIEKSIKELNLYKKALFYINITLFDKFKRSKVIKDFFVQFGLNGIFDELIDLLIDEKRIPLLTSILEFIVRIYKSNFNIMDFIIVSSHQLTDKEQNQIKNFLEKKTNKKVRYKIKIDPNLIAGLKIYSETLLWEHSIYSQLTSLLKD